MPTDITLDIRQRYNVGMEARYRKNAGAVFSLKYHLVWCAKYRRPVLVEAVATRLRELLTDKATELEVEIHALEVMPDHVHLFIESDPMRCVAELVNRFKGSTSHDLRKEFPPLKSRLPTLWSRSYYAASEGQLVSKMVADFVASQPRNQ